MEKWLIFFIPLAINGYFVVNKYGWADDWSFMIAYDDFAVVGEHLSGYRPILEAVFNLSFPFIESTYSLSVLRLIGSLGISMLTVKVYSFALEQGYTKSFATACALLIPLLPSLAIYARWATVFIYSWVLLIAFIAGELFIKRLFLKASVLLTICFLTYQPAATFAVIPLAFLILKNRASLASAIKSAIWMVGIFGLSTLMGSLINLIFGIEIKQRTQVITNVSEVFDKLFWVVTRPLPLAFRPFFVDSPSIFDLIIYFLILVLVAASIFVLTKKSFLEYTRMNILIGLAIAFLMSLLPLLPIVENQIEFRTLATSSSLGLIILVRLMEPVIRNWFKNSVSKLAGLAILISITTYSLHWSKNTFVDSYKSNISFIEETIKKTKKSDNEIVTYRIDYSKVWPQREQVGSLSVVSDLQMPWVLPGFLLKNFEFENVHAIYDFDQTPDLDFEILRVELQKELNQ